jgi:hypothetical protein
VQAEEPVAEAPEEEPSEHQGAEGADGEEEAEEEEPKPEIVVCSQLMSSCKSTGWAALFHACPMKVGFIFM